MTLENARDRWIEALLGARLRFHATDDVNDSDPVRRAYARTYWRHVYRRWSQLYHAQ